MNTEELGDRKSTVPGVRSKPVVVTLAISIDQLYESFMISRGSICSDRTIAWYEYHLTRFINWLHEQGIYSLEEAASAQTIERFMNFMKQKKVQRAYETIEDAMKDPNRKRVSDRYLHVYGRTIRTMVKYAVGQKWLEQQPAVRMPPIKKNKLPVLSEDEIKKVISACITTRDVALVLVATASGMRLSELCALNWADVNFKSGDIEVLAGKGGKYRKVRVDKETLRILLKYKVELGQYGVEARQPVFQTDEYDRLTPRGLESLIHRLSERSKVKVTPHALRRTFAKMCVRSGLDIVFIQQLMGHANIETTRRYIQDLDDEVVQRAYDEHAPIAVIAKAALRKRRA